MKVKMLSRRPDDVYRETKNDIHKVNRNFDPEVQVKLLKKLKNLSNY